MHSINAFNNNTDYFLLIIFKNMKTINMTFLSLITPFYLLFQYEMKGNLYLINKKKLCRDSLNKSRKYHLSIRPKKKKYIYVLVNGFQNSVPIHLI